MNPVKFALSVISAIFFFALGIYFHAYLPTGTRELASVASASRVPQQAGKFDTRVSNALRECFADRVRNGRLELEKTNVDGRTWSVVNVVCTGDQAKNLYEAVGPYASEEYVRFRDGRTGVGRFFGRLYPPSQCVRVLGGARGGEINFYSCSIRIDLDHEIISAIRF